MLTFGFGFFFFLVCTTIGLIKLMKEIGKKGSAGVALKVYLDNLLTITGEK